MKRCFFLLLWIFTIQSALADGPIYLPILTKGDSMAINPILRITNGTDVIDLLGNESGWELEDPYWNPQIAQYKSGGSYVNSGLAEGQRLVHKEYDNVIETIPLSAHGIDQNKSIQTVRRLLQMAKQASDYWTKSYEYDDVWIEARPACNDCLTGYARIVKMSIPEIANPYGQPFFSSFNDAILNGITLTIEREPLWRGLPPGEILGPMYNLLKNPDFELWNFGVADSQPDSWSDLETLQITGQNSREATTPNSGQYALKIRVSGSTAAGKAKGVVQIVESTKNNTEYTVVAHVRSEGVSNGVGRILVTYSGQLEVYRSSDRHGWSLYTGKFTTGVSDVVSINLEILTTAANTDGTIYIDSLMLLEGDFEEAATNGTLPYMTSSHIVNHWDQPGGALVEAGDINFVDVWDVPGDEDALVRLEVLNNTTPVDTTNIVERIATLRIGQRRTGNIFEFDNYHDPVGDADTTASSNDRLTVTPTGSWNDITTHSIIGGILARANEGRYRIIVRVYDAKTSGSPTLEARLRYWMGVSAVNVKTLDGMTINTRANWTVADLTPSAAMIWDTKYKTTLPGAWGATTQFRRSSGSGDAYFDYLLMIPTDGGYIKADINPAYEQGSAFTVDNTSSGMVGVNGTLSGTVTRRTMPGTVGDPYYFARGLAIYKGDLYIGTYRENGPAEVWRLQAGNWTRIYVNSSYEAMRSLAVYNGRLYGSLDTGGGAVAGSVIVSTGDGINWQTEFTANTPWVYDMIAFGGYLFLAGGLNFTPYVMRWDGSSLVNEATSSGSLEWESLAVYGGKLYAGRQSGMVHVRKDDGTWAVAFASGQDDIQRMVEFNGKLYIATADNGEIYSFDGLSWEKVYDYGVTISRFYTIAKLDNTLYAVLSIPAGRAVIISTTDGITWNTVYNPNAVYQVFGMIGYDGVLYITTATNPDLAIDAIAPSREVQFSVSDYQGGSFTAPPRRFADPRRHRWVFSYDRENYINNADDKALIGIGYVPRYLTLRGAN